MKGIGRERIGPAIALLILLCLPLVGTLTSQSAITGGLGAWLVRFFTEVNFADVSIAAFTGMLWWSTRALWRETKRLAEGADDQADKMAQSIAQATRAADAMRALADSAAISSDAATASVTTVKERTAQQMRAYLTVVVHGGVYQERDKGLKFEAKPMLINTGQTPAHKVNYWANAAILPTELPADFDFPEPENKRSFTVVLGPHQNFVLNAFVKDFIDDDQVEPVKRGTDKSLYIWGRITYEDIFGEAKHTNFCQRIIWLKGKDGEIVAGSYGERHNDAT